MCSSPIFYCPHADTFLTVSIARKVDPSLPAGDASYKLGTARYMQFYDNAKSKRILDLSYHTMEELVRDSVKQFKALGWY